MAKKKRKRTRRPQPTRSPRQPTMPDAAPGPAGAREPGGPSQADAEQRAAVRRTTARLVLFCVLVGLATAAVLIAQTGGG